MEQMRHGRRKYCDIEREGIKMNFYDKKIRRIVSIIIILIIVAMIATMVIPYLMV